jgi:hypothetical protein
MFFGPKNTSCKEGCGKSAIGQRVRTFLADMGSYSSSGTFPDSEMCYSLRQDLVWLFSAMTDGNTRFDGEL